jgi:hypothetical protein
MTYKKPFTADQRAKAASIYRSLRAAYRVVRHKFPPQDAVQRMVAKELRETISDFFDTLQVANAKVDVRRLNALQRRAEHLAVQYAWLRNSFGRPADA